MSTWAIKHNSPDSASVLTAALAALALTLLLFWGLAQSSQQLQAPRAAPAASGTL